MYWQIHFVTSAIQVASFMYIHFPAQDNIVSVVVNSFLQNGVNSTKLVLCSDNIICWFAEVIARTILFYRMKWTNDNMKKKSKGKKSAIQKKVDKLSHQWQTVSCPIIIYNFEYNM